MTIELTPAQLNEASAGTVHEWLGFVVTDLEPGRVRGTMTVRSDHLNPSAKLHGGVTVTFADSLAGYATYASLPDGATAFTTVNLTAHYLGPAAEGDVLVGEARLLNAGRQVQSWDVTITKDREEITVVRVVNLVRYAGP